MPVNSFEDYPMSWRPQKSRLEKPYYLSIAASRHMTFPICNRVLSIAVGMGTCKKADATYTAAAMIPIRAISFIVIFFISIILLGYSSCASVCYPL